MIYDELLDVAADVHQHETIDQHADQDRADHRAEHAADAAEQAGAADQRRLFHDNAVRIYRLEPAATAD